MTVDFYKLQVAGDDFLLVDLGRPGHEGLADPAASRNERAELAEAILDRRRGVGASALILAGAGDPIPVEVRLPDGSTAYGGFDAWLCVARWAFDSARASLGKLHLETHSGAVTVSALDSRSFALEIPAPRLAGIAAQRAAPDAGTPEEDSIQLILDGHVTKAWIFGGACRYAAAMAVPHGPAPRLLRTALEAAAPGASPILVQPRGRELLRFVTAASGDRLLSAATALTVSLLSGRVEREVVAEWRGKGSAVSFASFPEGEGGKGRKQAELIDRGRFWVEWRGGDRILVAGMAEYSFEGKFDF